MAACKNWMSSTSLCFICLAHRLEKRRELPHLKAHEHALVIGKPKVRRTDVVVCMRVGQGDNQMILGG